MTTLTTPSRDDLRALPRAELHRLLCAGHPIDPAELVGHTYHGVPIALPRLLRALSWQRFVKVFAQDAPDAPIRGWNVRTRPGDLEQPRWEPFRRRDGTARSFGHFEVVPATPGSPIMGCERGLVLDYGWRGRRAFAPMGRVRDPLVALAPGDTDLLLGVSALDLGLGVLGTPTYFCLQRAPADRREIVPGPTGAPQT